MARLTVCVVTTLWFFVFFHQYCGILALRTQTCTHGQLRTQLKSMLNCISKAWNQFTAETAGLPSDRTASTGRNNFCDRIYSHMHCAANSLLLCHDPELQNDILMIFELGIKSEYGCDKIQGTTKSINGSSTPHDGSSPEINDLAQSVWQRLTASVLLDRQCTMEQIVQSFKEENIYCFIWQFSPIVADISPILTEQRDAKIKSLPLCKAATRMLEFCFGMNTCFSQQEMDLLKDLAATYYKISMDEYVAQLDKHETSENLMETIGENIVRDFSEIGLSKTSQQEQFQDRFQQIVKSGVKMMADDYKVRHFGRLLKEETYNVVPNCKIM